MDGTSRATSVNVAIQVTGNILKLCGDYMEDAKDASHEVLILQRAILGLQETLQEFQNIFQREDRQPLADSRPLIPRKITEYISTLQALKARIDMGEREQSLSSLGLKAFPLKQTEAEGVTRVIEKYKAFMNLELYAEKEKDYLSTDPAELKKLTDIFEREDSANTADASDASENIRKIQKDRADLSHLFELFQKQAEGFVKPRELACLFCDVFTGNKGVLTRHLKYKHYPQFIYSCPKPGCLVTQHRKDKIRVHIRAHHRSSPNDFVQAEFICPSNCPLCRLITKNWQSFYTCILSHHIGEQNAEENRGRIPLNPENTIRDSDNKSDISNPPSIFSLQSVLSTAFTTDTQYTAGEMRTAIDELVRIFINDEEMKPLYRKAFRKGKIPRDRFIRNFKRILKSFAVNLKEESCEAIDVDLANLIMSKAGLVAYEIGNKLEQQYSQLGNLSEEMGEMGEVQAFCVSSDEEIEEVPEQAFEVKFVALVAHGRNFIENSVAFQILREQLMEFVIPSQRNENLAVKPPLKDEPRFPRIILFLSTRSSRILRLFLKYGALGRTKLKHLLSQFGLLEGSIPKHHERFRWTNRHGKRLYDDYIEYEPGALQDLRKHIETTTVTTNPQGTNGQSSSRAASMYTPNPQPAPTRLPTSTDITNQSINNLGSTQPSTALQNTGMNCHSAVPLLLLYCIERRGHPAKLNQEIVTHIADDRQLFNNLREIYYNQTGKFQSFWSLRTLHSIHFMKFGYGGHGAIDVRCHPEPCEPGRFCGCIPPVDRVSPQGDYSCRPIPPKLSPPFGPRYMMDLFQDPEGMKSNVDIILQQLPKKMNGELNSAGAEMVEAWGIFFRDDWNWTRIWVVLGVAFFPPSLLFGILWGIIRQDIQGAFGVASWWMTGATIAIGIIGSCT